MVLGATTRIELDDLKFLPGDGELIEKALEKAPAIEVLSFSGAEGMDESHFAPIVRGLQNISLKELTLSAVEMNDEFGALLGNALYLRLAPQLHYLDLDSNWLGRQSADALARAMRSGMLLELKTLRLGECVTSHRKQGRQRAPCATNDPCSIACLPQ